MKSRWYKNAVVYQIYPFSFMDSNNDGFGDIEGIISKLDYIRDLGATAIWFSPLYKSPDYDYGYDVSDYKAIDEKFGTMEDFDRLVWECHRRDLKVIMDMVINHTSTEHPWFKDAISSPDSPYPRNSRSPAQPSETSFQVSSKSPVYQGSDTSPGRSVYSINRWTLPSGSLPTNFLIFRKFQLSMQMSRS
jgi:glycosidase